MDHEIPYHNRILTDYMDHKIAFPIMFPDMVYVAPFEGPQTLWKQACSPYDDTDSRPALCQPRSPFKGALGP